LTDKDPAQESFRDPRAIAAFTLRKLQALRFMARPDVQVSCEGLMASLTEIKLALAQLLSDSTFESNSVDVSQIQNFSTILRELAVALASASAGDSWRVVLR
jgi:hypothetical protein